METFIILDDFNKVLAKYGFMMAFNDFRREICGKGTNL